MSKATLVTSVTSNLEDVFENTLHKTLILGLGNYLMGDEGVGIHVIHQMETMKLPTYLDVLDGGTGGFFLMGKFDEYKKIIIVDATMDGQPAGTISLIIPKRASDYPKALSVHDVGLKDMIEALYIQECLPEIHLITVSVSGIQPMVIGMTDSIEASIPETIETLLRIAKQIQDPNHSPLPQDT